MATTQYEAVPAVASDAEARGRNLVVMKFGGTSVGDVEKLKDVARRLVAARERGLQVVGVLSAMGDTTDDLIRLAHEVSPHPHPREYDMLVSVGERISNALCAMAIHDLGHEAISLTGSQAGIVTDAVHGKAKIAEVRARRGRCAGQRRRHRVRRCRFRTPPRAAPPPPPRRSCRSPRGRAW